MYQQNLSLSIIKSIFTMEWPLMKKGQLQYKGQVPNEQFVYKTTLKKGHLSLYNGPKHCPKGGRYKETPL